MDWAVIIAQLLFPIARPATTKPPVNNARKGTYISLVDRTDHIVGCVLSTTVFSVQSKTNVINANKQMMEHFSYLTSLKINVLNVQFLNAPSVTLKKSVSNA